MTQVTSAEEAEQDADRTLAVGRRLWRRRRAVFGSAFLLMICLCAIFAGEIAPADPEAVSINHRLQPPWGCERGVCICSRATSSGVTS